MTNIGPSGIIKYNGNPLFNVDNGVISSRDTFVGKIYDDGYIDFGEGRNSFGLPFNSCFIDQINNLVFSGVDSFGLQLVLPELPNGPTGDLYFEDKLYKVINGRICNNQHHYLGCISDGSVIVLRDPARNKLGVGFDEANCVNLSFKGQKSNGEKLDYFFSRPLARKNVNYIENEIIRYFEDYDSLNEVQVRYLNDNLSLWAKCGILQIVRKSEGTCAFGDIRHGASGVTGVRTGNVTLDKKEFDTEIKLYFNEGPICNMMVLSNTSYIEKRVNTVVSHEFGHQLEFILNQKAVDEFAMLYKDRLAKSDRLFPLPSSYDGLSEIVPRNRIDERVFYSGYSRESMQECFAESIAAFSVKHTREDLQSFDSDIYDFIHDIIFKPDIMLRSVLVENLLDIQLCLRLANIFDYDLLQK